MVRINEQFIIDKKGEKTAVVISFRDYENLLEDLHDLTVIAERREEKPISHANMLKRLKKSGQL